MTDTCVAMIECVVLTCVVASYAWATLGILKSPHGINLSTYLIFSMNTKVYELVSHSLQATIQWSGCFSKAQWRSICRGIRLARAFALNSCWSLSKIVVRSVKCSSISCVDTGLDSALGAGQFRWYGVFV